MKNEIRHFLNLNELTKEEMYLIVKKKSSTEKNYGKKNTLKKKKY